MLSDLRLSCKKEDIPIISDATINFLKSLLQSQKPKVCIEIGAAAGYSSCTIAKLIENRKGLLYSFEISFPQYKKCIQHISKYKTRNATCYHIDGTKLDLEKFVYEKVDFSFIDGQKAQYHVYLDLIIPRMNSNSTIVLDDCIKYRSRMKSLYQYLEKKQIKYKTHQLDHDDGIIVINID